MFTLTNRNVLHLLGIAAVLHICQARSPLNESSRVNTTDDLLWQSKEGTREEWMACRGMPKNVCEWIRTKKQEHRKILTKKFGNYHQDSSPNDNDEDQRMVFTEEQFDMMIAEAKKKEKAISTHRKKRTLIDFKKYPHKKWTMLVPYMFDGKHDDKQKAKIRAAFQHWANNTCIRFMELPMNTRISSSHILITNNETNGCHSRIGRANKQQKINLASYCKFATVLHEIGHSLGLEHEQSRIDRNDSVTILWSNIKNSSWHNYEQEETDAHGLPYNYGSLMHYSSKSGFSENGSDRIYALESLFQMNMGQRVDLSFHDRKITNLAYCKDYCAAPLTQSCQRGGYQNPNNCSICICPDGFSGQYCNQIAQPQNANCGGILSITSGTEQVIKSPGYNGTGYSQSQECTWWIKAPENHMLQLSFSGNFSIYCEYSACVYDWVEIKYKKDLGLEGARFCCSHRPLYNVTSESNEMMVIFRSNYNKKFDLSGFQAIVEAVSSRSISTSNPAAGSLGFLLLSVLLQLHHYLPYC